MNALLKTFALAGLVGTLMTGAAAALRRPTA